MAPYCTIIIIYHLQNNWTPLMYASIEGSAGVVELLIQHGAQLDIKNEVITLYTFVIFP